MCEMVFKGAVVGLKVKCTVPVKSFELFPLLIAYAVCLDSRVFCCQSQFSGCESSHG